MSDVILGIDLGTTNSSVAVVVDGRVRMLAVDGATLLPSVVGLSPDDTVRVGRSAWNQRLLHPERTVASVKRQMGEAVRLAMGDQIFSPPEISAMILRTLADAAAAAGYSSRRVVITVPAFFSDAQRKATREAGLLAGLQVERILNEPTAAALCYANPDETRLTLVYDLGGGTFDVSIVRSGPGLTEVLASHGDPRLGGDDFDALILTRLAETFMGEHGVDPRDDLRARVRLTRAAQTAKHRLSDETEVRVIEEHLCTDRGVPLHLDMTLTRSEYEGLIEPLVRRTRSSVQIALDAADVLARDLDEVVLVGGSTRTPRIAALLTELLGMTPRVDVNPDEAVALGAALHGARVNGDDALPILVDISPHAFGATCRGMLNGRLVDYCFAPVIHRNSVLPTRRTKSFLTVSPGQPMVDVEIRQGEHADARENLLVGEFVVAGLDPEADEGSAVDFTMALDLDGILQVDVVEQHTGLRKTVTLTGVLGNPGEVSAPSRARIGRFFADTELEVAAAPAHVAPTHLSDEERVAWQAGLDCLAKARGLRPSLDTVDRDEVDELIGELEAALNTADLPGIARWHADLADVLFYLE